MRVTSLNDIMMFGKYKELTIEELLYTNHRYIQWLIREQVVTFSDEILKYLNEEVSNLHLQGYNTPSSDWGGYEGASDDPFYGWSPH